MTSPTFDSMQGLALLLLGGCGELVATAMLLWGLDALLDFLDV
jgi:hypothetical protein